MKKAHEDGFAVGRFLIVKVAATFLELADAGNAQRTSCHTHPVPRSAGRLFLPREGDHPVFLPILAGIRREGLLKARSVCRDIGKGVEDKDVSSVE